MAYGAADPTLAKLAYGASMANVIADTSTSMTAIRDAYKSRMDNIEGIFKKIEEKNVLTAAELEDQLKPLMDKIADGTFTSDVVDATADHLADFRTAWKAIPTGQEGETDRLKWRSEVNKYTKGLEAEGTILSSAAGMVNNGGYNIQGTGDADMQFLGAIANYYDKKEGSNMARREVEDNEIVYYATIDGQEVRKTQSELKDLVVPIFPVKHQAFEKLLHNKKVEGTTLGIEYDANAFVNSVGKIIGNDKLVFADSINTLFGGMTKTVKQELHSRDGILTEDILGILNEGGFDDYDVDGVVGIDAKDFAGDIGQANFLKLTDALTNHKSENFNFRTAKLIAGTVLAAGEGRKQYDAGKTMFNASKKKSGGGGGGITTGVEMFGQTYPKPTTVSERKELQNMQNIANKVPEVYVGGVEYTWDKKTGKYIDGHEKAVSRHQLMRRNSQTYFAPESFVFSENVIGLDETKVSKSNILNRGLAYAKPPNVTKEKWDSLSEPEQMAWYLRNE